MKMINYWPMNWALHNKLRTSMLIEPFAETDNLIRKFQVRKNYNHKTFKLALFYYRLEVCL